MSRIRLIVATIALAVAAAIASPHPAGAVVCHDYPGGCCEDVTVLGKTILRIDC